MDLYKIGYFSFFYYCEVDIDDEDIGDESLPVVVCFLLRVYAKHSSFFMFHAYIRHVEQLFFAVSHEGKKGALKTAVARLAHVALTYATHKCSCNYSQV